jgi:exodeoxyribonuclease VII small subunit
MPAPKPRQSFEDLYRQLEETVTRLEHGGLNLDDSLSAYEEAVGLAQRCQQLLDRAELRITKLRESVAGANGEDGAESVEGEVDYEASSESQDGQV